MNVKELQKAYATLGLDEDATLDQARDAYLTWVCLIGHDSEKPVADPKAGPDLMHHELDLAWHAIEQAHKHGVLFPRRPRGCERCAGLPAVRVTLHAVDPGGFRPRTRTVAARLCRDCGLETARQVQRETMRRGWWGVLAPFANLRAISRNSTERAFLRRVDRPVHGKHRKPNDALPTMPWYRRRDVTVGRGLPLLAGLAALALILGITLPNGSTPVSQPQTSASTSSSSSATAGQ
jgi:hypothetical protein